jgi:hypothetical protein
MRRDLILFELNVVLSIQLLSYLYCCQVLALQRYHGAVLGCCPAVF